MPVKIRPERATTVPIPDQSAWPGLAEVPDKPVRAKLARSAFRAMVRGLDLRVTFPDGRVWGGGSGGSPVMRIVREHEFFARVGATGKIGFGEAYMVGAWTADDLERVLRAFAVRVRSLVPRPLQALRRWYDLRHPAAEDNDHAGARENISRHYDLSNEMFELFLDETMTYSSAWFEPGDTFADAQRRKIDGILDLAGVASGSRVIEIGTGWGSLAIRAAERGADVTTLTISGEQARLAQARIAEAGVADRVHILEQDYRDAQGSFDAVVSVEMIEAVGERWWPEYFKTLDRLLAPGGKVGLQVIVMPHDALMAIRNSYSWIHKYIFPGGLVLSHKAIDEVLRRHTSLRVAARRDLGTSYAMTLRQWRERFLARWTDAQALGFDDVFRRMWEFYFAYFEAGFRVGYLDVSQLSLVRDPGR
jgi:cyclopropane-fatty-acyl-phospholipid synthase